VSTDWPRPRRDMTESEPCLPGGKGGRPRACFLEEASAGLDHPRGERGQAKSS
jgi:hypothetical protein